MEHSVEPRELELPLELQFSMRKAELSAQEMCWEELYAALLNLYQQRLLEWCAVRALLADEHIELDNKVLSHNNKQGSLLGDTFEAMIGAIYMDKDYNFTRNFLLKRIIKPHIDIHTLELTETNFKSKLIEWCQHHGKDITFEIIPNEEGENTKLFTIRVNVDGESCAIGRDYNKKNAEKLAAEKACEFLHI